MAPMLSTLAGATGDTASYLDRIEDEATQFGLSIHLTDDRHRLAFLHGGRPGFPGWFPRNEGGAEGFWLDFRDRAGRTRATGGGLFYAIGPVSLAEFINGAGMDADGHEIRIAGEAAEEASAIRMEVGFSGNLIVFDQTDRKTLMSGWLTRSMPLINKAVLTSLYPSIDTFVTFVRDAQLDHLAPRYRLPILVPGVRWWRRFHGTAELHLGVQTREELLQAIRMPDSQQRPRPVLSAA